MVLRRCLQKTGGAPLAHSSPPCFSELVILLFLVLRGLVLLLRLRAVPGDDAGRCCRLLIAVVILPLHPAQSESCSPVDAHLLHEDSV